MGHTTTALRGLLLCALTSTSCMTSPDLRAADEAMREGDTQRAIRLYKTISRDGLVDPSQRAHVDRQLEILIERSNVDAALNRVKRGDEALEKGRPTRAREHYKAALVFGLPTDEEKLAVEQKLAGVDASILGTVDSIVLEGLQKSERGSCQRQELSDLAHLLSNPLGDAALDKVKARFASCAKTLAASHEHFSLVLGAARHTHALHPEWSTTQQEQIVQTLLGGLQSKDVGRANAWLEVAASDTRWQETRLSQEIERQREQAASRVIDLIEGKASILNPACLTILQHRELHLPEQRARTAALCQREIDVFVSAMEAAANLDEHLEVMDQVIEFVPLGVDHVRRLQSLLDRHAAPWLTRASGARTQEAKVVYTSIAHAIDRREFNKGEIKEVNTRLRNELRPPAVMLAEPSVEPGCSTSKEALLQYAPKSSSGSEPAAQITSSLDCSYEVKTRELYRRQRAIVDKNCQTFEIKTRSNAGFKCLETRDSSTGRTVKDCRYGYNSKTKTSTETFELCDSETTIIVENAVEVCIKASITGRVDLVEADGKTFDSHRESFIVDRCNTFTDTVPIGEESTAASEYDFAMSSLKSREETLTKELFSPVQKFVDDFIERESRELAELNKQRIARDLSSTDLDQRVRGALHHAIVTYALPSKQEILQDLVSTPLLLRVLDGSSLALLEARDIETLWALPEAEIPNLAPLSEHFERYERELKIYQAPGPKVRRITSLPDTSITSTAWLSTGLHQHSDVGATTVWDDRLEHSDFLFDAQLGWARELIDTRTTPQMSWNVSGVFRRVALGGGMKLDRFGGLTRGGHLSARWVGGRLQRAAGRLEPTASWSAGVMADWTMLERERALSLRVPVMWSMPILPRMSLDVGAEPDMVHLFSLDAPIGMSPRAARSMAWLGTTWSLWQSRLALHASMGPSFNASRTDWLTGRTSLHLRF